MSEKTPHALRKHVVLMGKANAGKSTLFNALTGQDHAIVSPAPGTTTDPVSKAMELIPFGPIVLVDTAGLKDESALGSQRMKKTEMALRRADAILYVADAADFDEDAYQAFLTEKREHLLVFTKCGVSEDAIRGKWKTCYPAAVFLGSDEDVEPLRKQLADLLAAQQPEDISILGDLIAPGGHIVLVTPVDSEAPKGRLILPQVQTLRECLDDGIAATVCREFELEGVLNNLKRVDLVVTDSQVFPYVEARVPQAVPLTSFSMLLARQKGNFEQLLHGMEAAEQLCDGDRILMLEGCTHNHTHEDIGRVKLPAMLRKKTGKVLAFDYFSGYDFPQSLTPYRMAIQCGNCMINRREITARLEEMQKRSLPVTNYGIALAWGAGILARASAIFSKGM